MTRVGDYLKLEDKRDGLNYDRTSLEVNKKLKIPATRQSRRFRRSDAFDAQFSHNPFALARVWREAKMAQHFHP